MILLRKFVINTGDLLGRILPRVFLYKKSSKISSLTIYNLHSTSEFLFPEYMSLLRQIQKNEEFINTLKYQVFKTVKKKLNWLRFFFQFQRLVADH